MRQAKPEDENVQVIKDYINQMSIKRKMGGAFDPVDTYEHMKDLGKLCIRLLNEQQNAYESDLEQLSRKLDDAQRTPPANPVRQQPVQQQIDPALQMQYEQRIRELEQRLEKYAEQAKYLDNAVEILKEARRSRGDMLQKAQEEADRQVLNAQSLARRQIQRLSEEVNLLESRKQSLLDDVTSIELALRQVRGSGSESRSQRVDADILEHADGNDADLLDRTSPFRARA